MRVITAANAIGQRQEAWPHMGDIKQACLGACPEVFVLHAHRILNRHFIAGERHKLRAQLFVQGMQRRALQILCRRVGHDALS